MKLLINTHPIHKCLSILISILLVNLGTASALICFLESFTIPYPAGQLYAVLLATSALFVLLISLLPGKTKWIPLLLAFLLAAIFVYRYRNILLDAFIYAGQSVWLKLMDIRVLPREEILLNESAIAYLPILILFVTTMLTIFTTYTAVKMQSLLLSVLITFPFLELGLYYGIVPPYLNFYSYLAFVLSMLSLSMIRRKTRQRAASAIPIFFCCALTISALLGNSLLNLIGYERPLKWDTLRNATVDEGIRALLSLPQIGGINGGWFYSLGSRENLYQTALKVTMPVEDQTVYLKGYVGSIYTSNRWKPLPEREFRQDKALTNVLAANNSTLLSLLSMQAAASQTTENTISIFPKLANKKYAYVPYTVYPTSNLKQDRDACYYPVNKNQYTLHYATEKGTPVTNQYFPAEADLSQMQPAYESFVQKHYLTVPASACPQLKDAAADLKSTLSLSTYASSSLEAVKNPDAFRTKLGAQMVKDYISSQAAYTLKPGTTPNGQDFVDYFLYTNQKGYCVHFATAATLLLRMLDIPSRYVEGYIVTQRDFQYGTAILGTDNRAMNIMDINAHAWTEYYTTDQGWLPLETTPGYQPENSGILSSVPHQEEDKTETSPKSATTEQSSTTQVATTESKVDKATTTESSIPATPQTHLPPSPLPLLLIPLLLLLAASLTAAGRRLLWELRLRHSSPTQTALHLHHYLQKASQTSHIPLPTLTAPILPLLRKAQFSQHTLTPEELTQLHTHLTTTRTHLYQTVSPLRKLLLLFHGM